MKKAMFLALTVLLLAIGSTAAYAATATLNPVADTYVHTGEPNSGHNPGWAGGNIVVLSWGATATVEGLMRFDFSGLPAGAVVTNATFWTYCFSPRTMGDSQTGATLYLSPALGNWDENLATWNNKPGRSQEVAYVQFSPNNMIGWRASTDCKPANPPYYPDTAYLWKWVNSAIANPTIAQNGLSLWMGGPNNGVDTWSREDPTFQGLQPYLVLDYTVVPEPASVLVLAAGILPVLIRRKRS